MQTAKKGEWWMLGLNDPNTRIQKMAEDCELHEDWTQIEAPSIKLKQPATYMQFVEQHGRKFRVGVRRGWLVASSHVKGRWTESVAIIPAKSTDLDTIIKGIEDGSLTIELQHIPISCD